MKKTLLLITILMVMGNYMATAQDTSLPSSPPIPFSAQDKGLYSSSYDNFPQPVMKLSAELKDFINRKDWEKILTRCLPEIQQKAKKYLSADAFFKSVFPEEVYSGKQGTFVVFVRSPKPHNPGLQTYFLLLNVSTDTPNTYIDILQKNGEWYLDFQTEETLKTYPEFVLKAENQKIPVSVLAEGIMLEDEVPVFAKVLGFQYEIKPGKYKPLRIEVQNAEFTRKEMWNWFVKILRDGNAIYKVEGSKVIISPDGNAVSEEPDEKTLRDNKERVKHSVKTPEELRQIRAEILRKIQEKNKK